MFLFTLLLGSLLLALLTGCQPSVQAHYNTAEDAQREGAFARGTLPTIIFPDATDINEVHDIGVEHKGATFHFGEPFLQRLTDQCKPYAANERVDSPFSSWPDFVNHRQTADQLLHEKGYAAHHCDSVTITITKDGIGYLWQ